MEYGDITLLSEEEIWGDRQLEVLKTFGTSAKVTDVCILTGGYFADLNFDMKSRTGSFWTKTDINEKLARSVSIQGLKMNSVKEARNLIIRPVIELPLVDLPGEVGSEVVLEKNYGEYPQYAVEETLQDKLEKKYKKGELKKTGHSYTFNSVNIFEYAKEFAPETYEEYSYGKQKYIRMKANSSYGTIGVMLSNGLVYKDGDYVWVEVSPITWLVDYRNFKHVSKKGLVSGISFSDEIDINYGDFNKTNLKKYLKKYMLKDMFQGIDYTQRRDYQRKNLNNIKKRENPYNLNFDKVSEEDIIRGAIESNIAVFLHGPSSEGKSARVKQIDPDCVIIYLRNASPESLNGKSVYNAKTGEMIDIKPSWLKKLEAKCEKEPDKLHILFFDEITNALPSIQGIAFNIVLDKEVNGKWKLPSNARIVAAGNDMQDSLAANELAEPLFNRFAHVYIETTTENWLKWASENNIHPAIYAYIAFKNGQVLRSKYDGEKPNADPRKWEMASKMLYATGKPQMIRTLVGENIADEFVYFCNQQVITLEAVLAGNYNQDDINALNTAERYATTMGLSRVDENNLEIVRNFVKDLGAEFIAIFDAMWTHGDEKRLERLAEAKLTEKTASIKI